MHKGARRLTFPAVSLLAAGGIMALGATLRADEPVSWRHDYREAYHEASRLEKPMIVQISAPQCRDSAAMQGETYRDRRISRQVNLRFIPVTLDAREDSRLVEQFGVSDLPATVIVSPDKRIVKRLTGFHPPDALERELVGVCTGSEPDTLQPIPAHRPSSGPRRPASSTVAGLTR